MENSREKLVPCKPAGRQYWHMDGNVYFPAQDEALVFHSGNAGDIAGADCAGYMVFWKQFRFLFIFQLKTNYRFTIIRSNM